MWQHGGVGLPPRGVAAGAGVGGGQQDALGVIFLNQWNTLPSMSSLVSFVFWLWESIWVLVTLTLARCVSSLLFSLYTYTYTYTYCYYYCILYFLVLTKPAPAWVPVKASLSTSGTIVTPYRHQSTNWFVPLYEMLIEILNAEEILVTCKLKLNQNLNLKVYREIQRNSNPINVSIWICTARYRGILVARFGLVD